MQCDRYLGIQVKARIELERLQLRNLAPSQFSRDIWSIVVEYVCDDPEIIDLILDHEIRAFGQRMIINRCPNIACTCSTHLHLLHIDRSNNAYMPPAVRFSEKKLEGYEVFSALIDWRPIGGWSWREKQAKSKVADWHDTILNTRTALYAQLAQYQRQKEFKRILNQHALPSEDSLRSSSKKSETSSLPNDIDRALDAMPD